MLKLFSKLFRRDPPAVSEPTAQTREVFSDAQLLRAHFAVTKEAEEALRRFSTLITVQLGSEESQRLTSRVVSRLRLGDTPDDAITSGFLDDEGQRPGKWLLIQVDWKATEEVEWQANELLAVAGVTETWQWQGRTNATVAEALLAFSAWVAQRQFHLLHLDLGHDAYYALLVPADKSEEVLRAAEEAGLKLQGAREFEAENAGD